MYTSKLESLFAKASRNKDTYRLAELLGLDYVVWRRQVLAVAMSSPYVSSLLPDEPEMHSTGSVLEEQDVLLSNGGGVAMIMPPRVENEYWPIAPVIHVRYLTPKEVAIAYGSWSVAAPCKDTGGRLEVRWPDMLGLNGDIRLDAPYGPEFSVDILTVPTLPVKVVADRILHDKEAYRELERAMYIEAFYQAARPDERIAIALAAVYKILTH